jgi:hypothetical protein
MGYDPVATVRRLKVPLLFIYGGSDPWIPVQQSIKQLRLLANQRPKIRHVVVPNANHEMMFVEHETRAFDQKTTAPGNPFPGFKDRGKLAIFTLDIHDFYSAKSSRIDATDRGKFEATPRASSCRGKESVEDAGRFIARMPCIADKDAAQTSAEHGRRAQSGRSASDDDGVEDLRVGRARRVGCDHYGDLKSSATAQNENQDERAYHGNGQGTDAPESVGEECELYGATLVGGFTCYWSRSRPMASKEHGFNELRISRTRA